MKRLIPQTLFIQTLFLLLLGIGLSLLVGAWIYSSARLEAVRAVGALAAAERIINLSRLIGEVPSEWRERLVRGSNDAAFRVALSPGQPAFSAKSYNSNAANLITDFLQQALPDRRVIAAVTEDTEKTPIRSSTPQFQTPVLMPGRNGQKIPPAIMHQNMMRHNMMRQNMMRRRMMQHKMITNSRTLAAMSWRGLQAAIQLEDGQWLEFTTSLPETGPKMSPNLLMALLAMAAMIALLTTWAVRRMTAPLRILSDAAQKLGRDVKSPPLVASGSVEMRNASEAFNQMQDRLRRMIENRTLMLGAISHDLRTQMTLLRLRLEAGEMTDEQKRMLKTISEMEEMLKATQAFSRDDAASEEQKRVDLGALLTSIVDDMMDAGLAVSMEPVDNETIIACKPLALRRALTNVIDNAVKYGNMAYVALRTTLANTTITIDDDGPGIPQNQLKQVLQPFYRLESSRNRETGGIGLGLAIAASIAEAHGGELHIANRPEGGLRITFTMPR